MQSNNSGKFILGTLLVVVVLIIIANLVLSNVSAYVENNAMPAKMDEETVAERLKPVGEETIGEEPIAQMADSADAATVPASGDDSEDGAIGQQIVAQLCATCHASGLMQSPRIGSASDWAPRIEQGKDTLYTHAIEGFNMMPARGGNPKLTDEEVKAAVDYMIAESE